METAENIQAYRSPILLLQSIELYSGNFSEEDLKKAIEKISQLDKNATITIEQINCTIPEALQTLQDTNVFNWDHHVIIYNYKGLLHFLQNNTFVRSEMEAARQFRYKPSFVQFISPFFSQSFQFVAANLIKNNSLNRLKELMEYSGFLGSNENAAYEPIFNYLHTFLGEARQQVASGLLPDEEQRQRLLSNELIAVFNSLPSFAAHLREEYLGLFLSLFRKSGSKVSAELWHEGWSMVKKIQGNNSQESEKENLEEEKPQLVIRKKFFPTVTENIALWSVGIFCVLGIVVIFSLLHKKEVKPEEEIVSGSFGGREGGDYAPVEDQLASSTNENNFRHFIKQLCRTNLQGTGITMKTGDSPFENMSTLPPREGNSTVTIRNTTLKDAVVFYFTSNNTLISENSRIYAFYIAHGDEFTFSFDANFGRLNFAFGKKWMKLKDPMLFPLVKPGTDPSQENLTESDLSYWNMKQFFLHADTSAFYLEHYLTIQDFEQPNSSNAAPFSKLLHEPSNNDLYSRESKYAELLLSGNKVKISGAGNLYVYQSP
jgi:hypothetical protein